MDTDPKAKEIISRFDTLRTERGPFERDWRDIKDLVRPHTGDIDRANSPGRALTTKTFDSTALEANGEMASGLHAYLTNPSDRWFGLEVEGMNWVTDYEGLEWLDAVADVIYREYSNPITKFNMALHQCYLDIGAFGQCIVLQEWNKDGICLSFRAIPVADCYFAENNHGTVDTLYRLVCYTRRQLVQEFGEENLPRKVLDEKDQCRKFEVIHAVYPRDERKTQRYDRGNKRFASCWVLKEHGHVAREDGYDSFPYHVARWSTLAGEVYGKGPGHTCLPDIKMLNRMEYTMLKALQKMVDPPLQVTSDGFMAPIETSPGSLIYREPGVEPAQPLEIGAKIPDTEAKAEQKRELIRRCFYNHAMRWTGHLKKDRQSMFEVQEIIDEQLRMMSPMVGRLEGELLSPLLFRSFELLWEKTDRIPPPPQQLQGRLWKPVYIGQAAKAQKRQKGNSINRFLQALTPWAQTDPSVFDVVSSDGVAEQLAIAEDLPRVIIRTPEAIEQIRAQRAQAQQMQQMAEAAKPIAGAIKDVASAQAMAGAGSIF